jgi:hypothetical protein
MDRNDFERYRTAIDVANAALNAHLDTVEDSMLGSGGGGSTEWLAEFDRLVRVRDEAEAALAAHL